MAKSHVRTSMIYSGTSSRAQLRRNFAIGLCVLLFGCTASQPTIDTSVRSFAGGMPADLSGSWERDYSRSDDVQGVLNSTLRKLSNPMPDQGYPGTPPPRQDLSKVVALAQMAELITRSDVLTITQDEYEVSIARKDDFSMLCEFYDGYAKRTESNYGAEVCSWDNKQLVSHLVLPDGVLISNRFSVSEDGKNLQVATTVSSGATRTPFTLRRVYVKFDPPESELNCVETLSMKRVCSTTEIFK